jgi:superfamily I DNA and/or RNA helicase
LLQLHNNSDDTSQPKQQQQQPCQLVLVGDPKQLPATIISQRAAQQGYSRSLFERLQQRGSHVAMLLDTQYCCRPEISAWPRQQFYGGQLQDGSNILEPSYGAALLQQQAADMQLAPFTVFDVQGSFEERGGSSSSNSGGSDRNTAGAPATDTSISNPMEVDVVVWLLKQLMQQHAAAAAGAAPLSVGVITPYRRQFTAILEQCSPAGTSSSSSCSNSSSNGHINIGSLVLDVRSVDGFQGQERDVIIFSAVRSNSQRNIGFLSDARRLNVALTRVRHMLVVVCNARTVSSDPTWAGVLASAKATGLLRALSGSADAEGAGVSGKLLSSLRARLQQRQWQEQLMRGCSVTRSVLGR